MCYLSLRTSHGVPVRYRCLRAAMEDRTRETRAQTLYVRITCMAKTTCENECSRIEWRKSASISPWHGFDSSLLEPALWPENDLSGAFVSRQSGVRDVRGGIRSVAAAAHLGR